jgi:site-specific DNA-methyltransferase (adenine-specific)
MARRASCTQASTWKVTHADCFAVLPRLDADSVDAIITDPPYGIGVNGMEWDRPARLDPAAPRGKPRRRPPTENPLARFQQFSREWSSACLRTLKPGGHLAAFAAPRTAHRLTCGLEEAGFEVRDVLMWLQGQGYPATRVLPNGQGTGLKPAWEPIVLARKPLVGTLDQSLVEHGTGALNIDACRIALTREDSTQAGRERGRRITANPHGRWPANLLLSHGESCTEEACEADCPIELLGTRHRFFYAAKPSRRERDAGCEKLPRHVVQTFKIGARNEQLCDENPVANIHPTVKPIELIRWLVRLLTPQGGLVLDPFTGSASIGAAAVLEGACFHGIEREGIYVPIARARMKHWSRQGGGERLKPTTRSQVRGKRAAQSTRRKVRR